MPWHIKLNISDWLCFFFFLCEYDWLCSYNIIHITLLYMDVNRKKTLYMLHQRYMRTTNKLVYYINITQEQKR